MWLRVAPGRRLRWSPAWSDAEASVLFDSASGDFWVLGHPSRELLRQIEAAPGLDLNAVRAQGRWTVQDLDEMVNSLVAADILAPEQVLEAP